MVTSDPESSAGEPGCFRGEERERGPVVVQVDVHALHVQPAPLAQRQDHLPAQHIARLSYPENGDIKYFSA